MLLFDPKWLEDKINIDEYNSFVPAELKISVNGEFNGLMLRSLDEINSQTFERVRLIPAEKWTEFAMDCVIKALYCQAGYNKANEMLKYSSSLTKIDKLGDYLKQFMTPLEQGLQNVRTQQLFVSEQAKMYLTRCGLSYRGNISVEEFINRWA